jgi:predicted HTH transcriptional regulator
MRATGRARSRPLMEEALSATRGTKAVEFKKEFDPSDRRSLCETLKDVLAMANSGGGILVVGVDGQGRPTGGDVS